MIFTVFCAIIHTYLCKREKILYGLLFAVLFTILINTVFSYYGFKVFMILGNFINSERAYAYYHLNDFEKALEVAKDIKIPIENSHPIDLVCLYQGFAVRALCYYEKGQAEEAKREILYAYNGVKSFSDSIQRDFIVQGYEKIMNEKV